MTSELASVLGVQAGSSATSPDPCLFLLAAGGWVGSHAGASIYSAGLAPAGWPCRDAILSLATAQPVFLPLGHSDEWKWSKSQGIHRWRGRKTKGGVHGQ